MKRFVDPPPVHVPPVSEAWERMRVRLDERMPVFARPRALLRGALLRTWVAMAVVVLVVVQPSGRPGARAKRLAAGPSAAAFRGAVAPGTGATRAAAFSGAAVPEARAPGAPDAALVVPVIGADELAAAAARPRWHELKVVGGAGLAFSAGRPLVRGAAVTRSEGMRPFSVGLSLRQVGGWGKVGDHIPGGFARMRLNSRVYVEWGVRLHSPQYTPSFQIDSTMDSSKIRGWQMDMQGTGVVLKELYYLDVPVSVHYNVARGLWVGAGAQYGRLWGGTAWQNIVMYPTSGGGPNAVPTVYSAGYIRLKNNPHAYAKIRPTDWRVLLDVRYTWQRFTLGVDYQQGLAAYAAGNRNMSWGVHLDYALWRARQGPAGR